jgi:negative regulator of flagellin synthesis FlgM
MVNNVNNGNPMNTGAAAYSKANQKLEQAQTEQSKQTAQAVSPTKPATADSVALTPQATQLKELQKRIGETDAFDRKKVEDIKKALADGEYKINVDRLASKLAAFEFEL